MSESIGFWSFIFLFIAFIIWMDYFKKDEKERSKFILILGIIFTIIGLVLGFGSSLI